MSEILATDNALKVESIIHIERQKLLEMLFDQFMLGKLSGTDDGLKMLSGFFNMLDEKKKAMNKQEMQEKMFQAYSHEYISKHKDVFEKKTTLYGVN